MKLVRKLVTLGLSVSIVLGSAISVNADTYNPPILDKVEGVNNYETAALVADRQGNYNIAILVNLDTSIADGLSSSGLSGAVNAPILLTKKDSIPEVTMTRLIKAKKVYIIGGTNSVSPNVENSLKSKGITVNRIQGKDRIETSLNVATEIKKFNDPQYVFFTNGFKGEADAISVSFLAAQKKCPIIQTDGKNTTYKVNSNQRGMTIGGNATMSETFVNLMNTTRIGGKDRFDTNQILILFAKEEDSYNDDKYKYTDNYHIADGYNLVNALIASPIAKYSPTVLVSRNSNKNFLGGCNKITAVGKIDNDSINELTKKVPVLGSIIGTWRDGRDFMDISRFNFKSYPYDIIKTNEGDNSMQIKVHYPDEDIEYLLILDDEFDELWIYTRSDVHGGFTGGTPFVRY
jgi:putative cell wall-binding protein